MSGGGKPAEPVKAPPTLTNRSQKRLTTLRWGGAQVDLEFRKQGPLYAIGGVLKGEGIVLREKTGRCGSKLAHI